MVSTRFLVLASLAVGAFATEDAEKLDDFATGGVLHPDELDDFATGAFATEDDSRFSVMDKSRFDVMDQLLELSSGDESSGWVAIVQRDGEAYAGVAGYSNVDTKEKMSINSIFRICSMSKPITAVAVMQLVENGQLDLADPLSKYIPSFENMKVVQCKNDDCSDHELVDADREITIQHLLSHTSGLSYGDVVLLFGQKNSATIASKALNDLGVHSGCGPKHLTLEDWADRVAQAPLASHPGQGAHYGVNSDILGRVIEVVSGMSFGEYLERKVFDPLGMMDTKFFFHPESRAHDDEAMKRLVSLHHFKDGKLSLDPKTGLGFNKSLEFNFEPQHGYSQGARTFESGGCGLVSTAYDYSAFAQMLLNYGKAPDGTRILGRVTVQNMLVNRLKKDDYMLKNEGFPPEYGTTYGLGLGGMHQPSGLLHSSSVYGWAGLHGTRFFIDYEHRMTAVIMTNCNGYDLKCIVGCATVHRKFFNIASSMIGSA